MKKIAKIGFWCLSIGIIMIIVFIGSSLDNKPLTENQEIVAKISFVLLSASFIIYAINETIKFLKWIWQKHKL